MSRHTTEDVVRDECSPQHLTVRTSFGNTAVHVYNKLEKRAVVAVHGLGGRKEQFEESHIATHLASRFRVITFDLYGHGSSSLDQDECARDITLFSKDFFVEQLDGIVNALLCDVGRFHLYGFSTGCFISLHYAKKNPERVGELALHSPWNGELRAFAPGLKTVVRAPLLGILCAVRKICFKHCHNIKTFKKIILRVGEGTAAWHELLEGLATSEIPRHVLIICGEAEKPMLRIAQSIDQKLGSKSKFFSVPKAGHMTWWSKCNQPVGVFFRDNIFDFFVEHSLSVDQKY